jgi:hypothetical protein
MDFFFANFTRETNCEKYCKCGTTMVSKKLSAKIKKNYKAGVILKTQNNIVVRNRSSRIWGFPKGSMKLEQLICSSEQRIIGRNWNSVITKYGSN